MKLLVEKEDDKQQFERQRSRRQGRRETMFLCVTGNTVSRER